MASPSLHPSRCSAARGEYGETCSEQTIIRFTKHIHSRGTTTEVQGGVVGLLTHIPYTIAGFFSLRFGSWNLEEAQHKAGVIDTKKQNERTFGTPSSIPCTDNRALGSATAREQEPRVPQAVGENNPHAGCVWLWFVRALTIYSFTARTRYLKAPNLHYKGPVP